MDFMSTQVNDFAYTLDELNKVLDECRRDGHALIYWPRAFECVVKELKLLKKQIQFLQVSLPDHLRNKFPKS